MIGKGECLSDVWYRVFLKCWQLVMDTTDNLGNDSNHPLIISETVENLNSFYWSLKQSNSWLHWLSILNLTLLMKVTQILTFNHDECCFVFQRWNFDSLIQTPQSGITQHLVLIRRFFMGIVLGRILQICENISNICCPNNQVQWAQFHHWKRTVLLKVDKIKIIVSFWSQHAFVLTSHWYMMLTCGGSKK